MSRCGARVAFAACLSIAAGCPAPASEPDATPTTRASMGRILESLQILLPLSLSQQRFSDPAERERVIAALTALAESAGALDRHGREPDAGFAFLGSSLAREARELRHRYERGQVSDARFGIQRLTEHCVACHSRLPSDRDSPLSRRFVREGVVPTLPLEERAQLAVATRQFDVALQTLETLFADPETAPADLDLMGFFDDYLELCLRVRDDFARARRSLERVLARDDLSPALRADVETWVRSLREIPGRRVDASGLVNGRARIREAEARGGDPRRSLVEYVAASAQLHRFVASDPPGDAAAAEAYYRLGVVETRIGRATWVSQAEFFLETSIRLDPGGPFAPAAFALLEEFLISGFTGSGERVPADVRLKLRQLDALIGAARQG